MRGRALATVLLAAIGVAILIGMPGPGPEVLTTRPGWHELPLTNARTGETFTFRGFAGRTVFVEPMATWCHNCRTQLGMVREVHARVDPARVVFVALSIETSLSHAELARYADAAGFDWVFAVASLELYEELVATFGHSVVNTAVTPHFVIRPDGSTSALATGDRSVESLIQILSARGV
ncbi:MAG: redoxin domain-containing protein [Chloroflexi bacterium]|nr:redoxin domain-containing protein [Chloroflexota bacterium]